MSRKWFKRRTLGWELSFFSSLIVFHLKMSPHGPVVRTQFNLKIYLKELFQSLSFYSCNLCIFNAYDVLGHMVGAGDTLGAKQVWSPLSCCSSQPMGGTHIYQSSQTYFTSNSNKCYSSFLKLKSEMNDWISVNRFWYQFQCLCVCVCVGEGWVSPHQWVILRTRLVSYNSIQFWYYLLGDR